MIEIVEAIDEWTNGRYDPDYNIKLWGFSELMRKTAGEGSVEEVFPVTYSGRERVAIKDTFNFITWMRWQSPATYETSEEWSYGRNDARVGVLPIRLVLAHAASLGENVVFDFINALPHKFSVPGYQFVFVNAELSADPDHEAIVQAELGPANYMVYEKHRFTWNVYVLNINVRFMLCPAGEEDDSIISESGAYIQDEDEGILITE